MARICGDFLCLLNKKLATLEKQNDSHILSFINANFIERS